ncbi:MAG: hypothetical protein ACE5HW_05835 [Candidatus Methanofastidiosia archaeon]
MKPEMRLATISIIALLDMILTFSIFAGSILGIVLTSSYDKFTIYVLIGRMVLFAIGFFLIANLLIYLIEKWMISREERRRDEEFLEFERENHL